MSVYLREMDNSPNHFVAQSDALLAAIIETAIDGIVIIDQKGVVQTLNPAAAKLFGYASDEVIGKNVSMLMGSPHREAHDGYLARYHETREARIIGIGREIDGRKKDGTMFPARLAVSEVNWKDTVIYAGFIHDLTQVKTAEQRILDLNSELESKVRTRTDELQSAVNKLLGINRQLAHEVSEREAAEQALMITKAELESALEKEKELNELKSRFVAMASHEFRTPLSTILSSAALISRYTTSEQQPRRDKHLAKITTAVESLNGILNDFLSLSKIEEGQHALKIERYAVAPLVQEVIDEIEGLLKEGQVINLKIPDAQLEMDTDKQTIKNILYNLLSNAIKYSPENSAIECQVKGDGDKIRMAVKDEGIGIPQADQKHLFSRFFRASNAVNIQGTGLGLNIVAGYVELLGGTIAFESDVEKGSTFTLEFPKSQ